MGYTKSNSVFANTQSVAFAIAAPQTASANGAAIELGDRGTMRLDINITAASGTNPTLDVSFETSSDNVTWRALGSFPQYTAAGTVRKSFSGCDRWVRPKWTITGTNPSFTFTIIGDAV